MAITPAGRGPQVMGIYLLFLILSTVATALRVYCRAVVIRLFGWDDCLAVLAWAFFACFAACAVKGVYHGTGQHAWDIQPPSELTDEWQWWWLCEPLYVLSNMAIKASIAIMLLRLLVDVTQRTILYVVLIATELYSAAFFLLFVFQCSPVSYFWTRFAGAEGACLNTSAVTGAVYAYSAIMCVGDWTFSILPVIIVWKLEQLPKREKAMVGIILAMSAIASIATIARIPYIHTLSNKDDFLYVTSDVAIWSCTETGLAITACCCATLRPLFRRLLDRTKLPSSRTSGHGSDRRARSWQPLAAERGGARSVSIEAICLSPDLKGGKSGFQDQTREDHEED
ncbi:hypothetical protein DOTSEDRAFT_137132 [Dothistroma septosporum NZE10]|uniref:Rhodopsin domain-containing protein n=1 Tax=Dothistroma septosporum (strain NZE10 / CBS 128990) TaxID=675120 RepID=N1PH46_DOTSN|nr:hypothetical protein DOTSEDRAFT_137132 [Dothistroma septosporum NZE10]